VTTDVPTATVAARMLVVIAAVLTLAAEAEAAS